MYCTVCVCVWTIQHVKLVCASPILLCQMPVYSEQECYRLQHSMLSAKVNELPHPLLAFSQDYPDCAVLIPRHVVRQSARRSYFLNSLYPMSINAAWINNQLLSCSNPRVPSSSWVDFLLSSSSSLLSNQLPALAFRYPRFRWTGY